MKVGLYISTQFAPGFDVVSALNEIGEQVRRARQCGFQSLWAPHHYLTQPVQMLASVPLLAYLLRDAEGMTIGPNILIMPLLNPVHVAEDAVTLDLLSGGRYVLGEFASAGATMSFQLCGGVFSSPCRPMNAANASMPWTGLPNSSLMSLMTDSTAAALSVLDGSCVR